MSAYLKLGGTLVVDGLLLLPEDISEEERNRLAGSIEGTGTVQTGNTVNFVIAFNFGNGTVEKRLLPEGIRSPEKRISRAEAILPEERRNPAEAINLPRVSL